MISKIDATKNLCFSNNQAVVQNQNTKKAHPKNGQEDPLMNYPARGLAYSNEVGVALAPLNKVLAEILWVPALLYMGADIYDKYQRGEKGDYEKPSPKAGIKAAVFQGVASCLLPIYAVNIGQHLGSKYCGHKSDSKLTADSQMEILTALERKIGEGLIGKKTTKQEAQEHILNPINNLIENVKDVRNLKERNNLLTFSNVTFKETPKMSKENITKYINSQLDEVLELKEQLLNSQKSEKKTPEKLQKYFDNMKTKYVNDTNGDTKALRETLQKFVKQKTIKPNTMKTVGGFIGLIALAIPIDYVTEHFIIKKAVDPALAYTSSQLQKNK